MAGGPLQFLGDIFLWTKTRLFYVRYLLHIGILFLLEGLQLRRGKTISAMIPSLIFFSVLLFICQGHGAGSLVTFLVFLYNGIETTAWYSVDSGITFRFLEALDLPYALSVAPLGVATLCLTIIFLACFASFPFMGPQTDVRRWSVISALLAAMIATRYLVEEKLNTLYPFQIDDTIPEVTSPSMSTYERVNASFKGPWTAQFRPGATKKNLILLEIESFESKLVGKFNPLYPKSMPYLSSLTDHAMYFTDIKQQPYNTWSAAGMFVVQCGFPLLTNDVVWSGRSRGGYEGFRPIKCVPDLLKMIGYKLYGFCSRSCNIMRMKYFLRDRGYRMQDTLEHRLKGGDEALFEMLGTKVLPQLKAEKEPFVMLIMTDDTHFTDHFISPKCDDYLARENYPKILRSFTCVDQMIQRFVEKIKELGMDKDTVFLIFGDHYSMSPQKFYKSQSERSLSVFFPLRGQDKGWQIGRSKEITYYDMAPTIMDLLEVDYSPRFPFGSSMIRPGTVLFRD